ncbi:hypothetical protein ACTWQL_19435 [Pseudalkalibacillus sp. R45]|uniref:hypothetical protein n=1 Tax=Pseudalkalibacillus sp. R45 TaxID=3457433 RepID=UPI003FCD186A
MLTDEQIDTVVEDEELTKISNDYYSYKITYREFLSRKADAFARLGIDEKVGRLSHQERINSLDALLDEGHIDKDLYKRKLKRVLQDIEDEK